MKLQIGGGTTTHACDQRGGPPKLNVQESKCIASGALENTNWDIPPNSQTIM